MNGRGQFTTTIMWHDSTGGEVEAEVRVVYQHHKGSPQTMIDPEEPASVEIISIKPVDPSVLLPADWRAGDHDETLHEECFADWQADQEDIAEWLAQSRRDDRLMEGF